MLNRFGLYSFHRGHANKHIFCDFFQSFLKLRFWAIGHIVLVLVCKPRSALQNIPLELSKDFSEWKMQS